MRSRALIIDDDPAVRRLFQRFFQGTGASADAVADKASALAIFAPNVYEVALCDVDLGRDDGIETAMILRRLEPSLRIVVVSGLPDNLERAKAAGFEACLLKPCSLEELSAAVRGS